MWSFELFSLLCNPARYAKQNSTVRNQLMCAPVMRRYITTTTT